MTTNTARVLTPVRPTRLQLNIFPRVTRHNLVLEAAAPAKVGVWLTSTTKRDPEVAVKTDWSSSRWKNNFLSCLLVDTHTNTCTPPARSQLMHMFTACFCFIHTYVQPAYYDILILCNCYYIIILRKTLDFHYIHFVVIQALCGFY